MNSDADILRTLNDDINLDLIKKFDLIDNPFNPYNDHEVQCLYYDKTSLPNFPCADRSLVMSLNIRSISSNFDELQHFICDLESKNVPFDIISLQEVWSVPYPDMFILNNFQSLVFKSRINSRGGGIGFFVRKGLNFKILDEYSVFVQHVF